MSSSAASAPSKGRLRPFAASKFLEQSQKLSLGARTKKDEPENAAVAARFVTPRDAVIETQQGERLPAVPAEEAERLNRLREESVEGAECAAVLDSSAHFREEEARRLRNNERSHLHSTVSPERQEGHLDTVDPPAHTHPLFPPLPLYGPPSLLRDLQCQTFRFISFWLSLSFLSVVVVGSCVNGISIFVKRGWLRIRGIDPDVQRPFYREEIERKKARRRAAARWNRAQRNVKNKQEANVPDNENSQDLEGDAGDAEFPPLEGGDDPIVCDVGYYARRVGLDAETFKVQTEDGFILSLWHIYNPHEYTPLPEAERDFREPDVFYAQKTKDRPTSNRRYPLLLIHGLLQSAGAYCVNDDDSLAFYLCKAGYDVWLGNNRCGFKPQHKTLKYTDPRMWCWNIRHMGVLDLPAFVSRVLYETGFETLGLVCHSQGTAEAMVALAQDQRPELGERISIFCGLAPAAYAGPLCERAYFRFLRMISHNGFRIVFGIHAFIPFMMTMHKIVPPHLYGTLGYRVFAYLFKWTDSRWDRDLRDRMFQFSPVYVSSESMRWWLGCDGFAVQQCILATKEEGQREEEEDRAYQNGAPHLKESSTAKPWYGPKTPPFALWIAGSDDLVDGERLLRRLQNGREPYVNLVHHKTIEGYEHLDVIWAIDVIEQVGREVVQVVWRTVPEKAREVCRVPKM